MTQIAVSPARRIGTIDRKMFGGFVEHLGRCIYGGLYDEGSPLADERGFRQDVLGLLRELRMGVLRWPGGNFVSNYHWPDGVGPRNGRPRRPEIAWGAEESNRFGTDEFLAYCAELGTEPYICLNMGTGTLREALDWVEYCNGAGNTHWANIRRANGRDQPYRVRYWGLGNEMYGEWQVGAVSAGEYVREATRWARAIKMLDPDAKLVSCGMNGWSDWDQVVIDGLAPLVDYHSIHIYTGSDDYWTDVLQPHQAERAIACAKALLKRAAHRRKLSAAPRIAYDEWNVWFRQTGAGLEERYTQADALAVATYLNIFVRNCDWVRMANLAQMVNAIAPIVTSPETVAVQPIYYPVLLHARAALDAAADVHVDGATVCPDLPPDASRWPHHVADLGPFTLIDAAASVTDHMDRVAVTLVNRSPDEKAVGVFNDAGTAVNTNLDNGVLASAIDSAWAPSYFVADVKKSMGQWRASPMPQWAAGANVGADWGGSTYPVFSQSKHTKEAAAFAEWLTANQASWNIVQTPPSSLFPTYLPTLQSSSFKSLTYPISGKSQPNQVFSAGALSIPQTPWPPFMTQVLNQQPTTFGGVLTGKETLAQAFASFQQQEVSYAKSQGFNVSS